MSIQTRVNALIGFLMRNEANNGVGPFIARPEVSAGRKVVVCVGDSITRGQVSCDYVRMLGAELGADYCFVNAGINSELSTNVLDRLAGIARCKPDYVTVLIGTNDAHALIDPRSAARARRFVPVAEPPSVEAFGENLASIARFLRERTRAKIAILSIPPIGEDPSSPAAETSLSFCRAAERAARSLGVAYLPLFEEMSAGLLRLRSGPGGGGRYSLFQLVSSVVSGRLLRLGYDAVSGRRGFVFHTDLLHLNCAGAEIVARLIVSFLRSS